MVWIRNKKNLTGFEDEAHAPVQMVADSHCQGPCADPVSSIEVEAGWCFPCRLIDSVRNKTKLVIRGWSV